MKRDRITHKRTDATHSNAQDKDIWYLYTCYFPKDRETHERNISTVIALAVSYETKKETQDTKDWSGLLVARREKTEKRINIRETRIESGDQPGNWAIAIVAKQGEKQRLKHNTSKRYIAGWLFAKDRETRKQKGDVDFRIQTMANVGNRAMDISVCETRRDTSKRWPVDGIGLSLGVSSRNEERNARKRERERHAGK